MSKFSYKINFFRLHNVLKNILSSNLILRNKLLILLFNYFI
nr:MAG TPA: hypothetical protein [Caudoviricetes sp.]DAT29365.1 MAG TPA: hypothetical protein [Caudoviricetes sp.]